MASFTECSEILVDCSTFLIPSFPGLYPMVSVSIAWRPKGTATDQKKSDGGGRENQKTKIWARENVPLKHLCKVKPKGKIHAWTKTNQATMASGEVKMAAKHYTRLLNFLLNRAFLSVLRKNAAWTEVSHIFWNVFLEKYSTFKGEIWPFFSTCSTKRSVACYILCYFQITQLRRILRKKQKFGGKF